MFGDDDNDAFAWIEDVRDEIKHPSEYTNATSFCLTSELMTHSPSIHDEPQLAELFAVTDVLVYCERKEHNSHSRFSVTVDPISTIRPLTYYSLMCKRTLALLAAGLLSVLLREANHWNPIQRVQYLNQIPRMACPVPSQIPFSSMMDLPLPFSSDAAKAFATCHLVKMTKVKFLQDGEWTGVFSVHYDRNINRILVHPMDVARVTATVRDYDSSVLDVHGTVEKSGRIMNFDGEVDRGTGQVGLRMRAINSIEGCDCNCIITPVGIVGSWRTRSFDYHGLIWFWKSSWTAEK